MQHVVHMIELREVTFAYAPGQPVFERFNWSVERGETWAVVGASGGGKSTLLMMLAGLRRPLAGQVLIDGQLIVRPRPRTGLVLQDYGLLPWATVEQNVALGLKLRNYYGPDGRHAPTDHITRPITQQVDFWLKRLGIDAVRKRFPAQISGGQRQRAAIARTLVLEPDVLLMDEPFAALDAVTREDLQNLTLELQREQSLTLVMVTHNIEDAVFLGQRILVLGRPPHTRPLVVDNPSAGSAAWRMRPEFYEKCAEVRGALLEQEAHLDRRSDRLF
ncbi:MAG: ATP-binding cassette domain-containing protein [Anaerolineae bacterium]|nr:ATP-binding cassette domain-containing protein [Thermoflexales bacterium]MDW8407467.1 ATP-binding cassette domain-containing protein [Anaerolineae bacterium]